MKDGRALETPAENIAELTIQAQAFSEKQLPALKALGVREGPKQFAGGLPESRPGLALAHERTFHCRIASGFRCY